MSHVISSIGNAVKSAWVPVRNAAETAGSLAGNFLLPGSSLLTDNLVSKGSQKQLNSPLGQIAQLGTGLTGGGAGESLTGIPSASEMGGGWTNALNGLGGLFGNSNLGTNVTGALGSLFNGNSAPTGATAGAGGNLTGIPSSAIADSSSSNSGPLSYLKNLFGTGASPATSTTTDLANEAISPELANADPTLTGASSNGTSSPLSSLLSKFKASNDSAGQPSTIGSILKTVSALGPLVSAIKPTTYPGTQSQSQIQSQLQQQGSNQAANNAAFITSLNSKPLNRAQTNPAENYYTYGSRPEQLFYNDVNPQMSFPTTNTSPVMFAAGGIAKPKIGNPNGALTSIFTPKASNFGVRGIKMPMAPAGLSPKLFAEGGDIPGGQSDNINANVSPGEYIMPADVTSALGDGDTDAGAKKFDALKENIRIHKAGNLKKGKLPPKAKSPLAYMAQKGA